MNKVIVVGSINMDVIVRVEKLPLPGETIRGKSVEYLPGGKGLNQAAACAKMGEKTLLAGRLGTDVFAETLTVFLQNLNIDTRYIRQSRKESGTAFITVDEKGQNTIVVVPGSNADVGLEDIEAVPIDKGDIVISQFEIAPETVLSLFKHAKNLGASTILNPSPITQISAELMRFTDVLIINETELGFLKGQLICEETPLPAIIAAAEQIRSHDAQTVIVTLGSRGALVTGSETCHISGQPVAAIDTVGAGDCFAGVLASQLLKGKQMQDCVCLANTAASVCVTRKGAAPSMPTVDEVLRVQNDNRLI